MIAHNMFYIQSGKQPFSPAKTWASSLEICTDNWVSPTLHANDSGETALGEVEPSTDNVDSFACDADDQIPPLVPLLPRMSRIRFDSLNRCRRLAKLATDICLNPARRERVVVSSSTEVVDELLDFLDASAAPFIDIDLTLEMSEVEPEAEMLLRLHLIQSKRGQTGVFANALKTDCFK